MSARVPIRTELAAIGVEAVVEALLEAENGASEAPLLTPSQTGLPQSPVSADGIDWMSSHPEFLEAVSRGKAVRLKQWETAGLKSAQTQEGGNPGMIQFGLRNAGKEDWVDEKNVNLGGAVGTYDLSKLSLEQLRDLRQILGPLATVGDRQGDSEA